MSSKKPDKGSNKQQQPVVDRSKAQDLNMMVLKRIDSQIEEILATAGHVCLYRMSVDDQQWQRKNIEGSLFLIKRRTQPRFQMLVLNKLSTDNYTEPIHGGLELETNPPYLMYTHGNDEIHGIWFFDEHDLHRLSGLLAKILNQLPKPDGTATGAPAPVHYQQAAALEQPAASAAAAPAAGSTHGDAVVGGDGFWDRNVHVTEETLQHSQQLVPNSNLLEPSGSTNAAGLTGGLQDLLKAAQQKHSSQRATQAAPPSVNVSPVPIPNSTSMPAEPAAAGSAGAGAAALLTPAFFEQQKAKQQPPPAGSNSSTSAAVPEPAPVPVAATASAPAAPNGAAQGGNPLQALLSRAAKSTPSSLLPSAGSSGGVRGQPQPPLGVLSPEVVRDKVKAALIRLANNDAFVDIVAQELKTVGLLQ